MAKKMKTKIESIHNELQMEIEFDGPGDDPDGQEEVSKASSIFKKFLSIIKIDKVKFCPEDVGVINY